MRSVGRLGLALAGAALLAACAAPPRSTTLDPLFSAEPGTGAYEHEPPAGWRPASHTPRRCPPSAPDPAPQEPEACAHVYALIGTHSYVDPLTGMPALCAVVRCSKCGDVRHECQPGPRR